MQWIGIPNLTMFKVDFMFLLSSITIIPKFKLENYIILIPHLPHISFYTVSWSLNLMHSTSFNICSLFCIVSVEAFIISRSLERIIFLKQKSDHFILSDGNDLSFLSENCLGIHSTSGSDWLYFP